MTSAAETVEVIEATWEIPNFQSKISDVCNYMPSGRIILIGGGVVPPDPQAFSTPPVKLGVWLIHPKGNNRKYHVVFHFSDENDLPSSSVLTGKLQDIQIEFGEHTIKGVKADLKKTLDFFKTRNHEAMVFSESEVKSHMDKGDGSLKIFFKLEITHNFSMPTSTVNGSVAVLLNDFESLLKSSKNADVEIKVSLGKGQTFQCHKAILAARSPIFSAMFESDMKERIDNVVEVDDILPKTMENFLSFLYCGRFPDSLWIQSLPQLAYAADKYCVESLKNLCDVHLIRLVSFRNALALGKLAERHGLKLAAEKIREFIAKYKKEVTLDTEVEICDANFKLRYSIPNSPTKTT